MQKRHVASDAITSENKRRKQYEVEEYDIALVFKIQQLLTEIDAKHKINKEMLVESAKYPRLIRLECNLFTMKFYWKKDQLDRKILYDVDLPNLVASTYSNLRSMTLAMQPARAIDILGFLQASVDEKHVQLGKALEEKKATLYDDCFPGIKINTLKFVEELPASIQKVEGVGCQYFFAAFMSLIQTRDLITVSFLYSKKRYANRLRKFGFEPARKFSLKMDFQYGLYQNLFGGSEHHLHHEYLEGPAAGKVFCTNESEGPCANYSWDPDQPKIQGEPWWTKAVEIVVTPADI